MNFCIFRHATISLPILAALLLAGTWPAGAQNQQGAAQPCATDNGGITLPAGFCATVFADGIGHARHFVVAPDGVVYVNTWSGSYYNNDTPHAGGFLVALKDSTGDGRADVDVRFGPTHEAGNAGGSGIALYEDWLYAETNDRIVRYRLTAGTVAPSGLPEVVVSGLPLGGDHPMHPFVIDAKGNLYVDLGSATNACQRANRMPRSPGHQPCTELEIRGGTWRYDANQTGQHFSPAQRFATGLRNGEGFAFDSAGRLFATQHGRDQLYENWPALYTEKEGQDEPAEELVQLQRGADFGWPECYFDLSRGKLVLAPEYGGDGGKKVGICAGKREPVAAFPAHWAPNDLMIYNGHAFPTAYQGGAFLAFHGSWNRAPGPQGGYNVVFQPLKDGKSAGKFVVFADGFAGAIKEPDAAAHRPSGLALGPDGAIYISDDIRGRIWRVTYRGPMTVAVAAASAPSSQANNSAGSNVPPEGIHPDAGAPAAGLPTPPGATAGEVTLGERIYHGEVDGGTCAGCHGWTAKGGPQGPDLTANKWLWGDGSLGSLAETITEGVAHPKAHAGAMPPLGGADLSHADVQALAAYVWALSHPSGG